MKIFTDLFITYMNTNPYQTIGTRTKLSIEWMDVNAMQECD